MSITIKSGSSTDLQTIDATSKAGRVTLYDTSGTAIGDSSITPVYTQGVSGRNFIGNYSCVTFRILGNGAGTQNLASIENPSTVTSKIAIKRFVVQVDTTAALTSVSPSVKVSMPASIPTGGTVITAAKHLSTYASATAVIRAGSASDGGVATAITATPGNIIWSHFVNRMHTAAGFVEHMDHSLLPTNIDESPFILLPGESLLVQAVGANANTTHFVIKIYWEEYS